MSQSIEEVKEKLKPLDRIKVNGGRLPDDIESLEEILISESIDPSHPSVLKEVEKRVAPLRAQRDKEFEKYRTRPSDYIEKRNKSLGKRDEIVISISSAFTVWLPIISFVMLAFTEVVAITLGVLTFWREHWIIVGALSATIVLAYYYVEWEIAENKHQTKREYGVRDNIKWNLRRLGREIQYRLSTDGTSNIPDEINPFADLRSVKRVRNGILLLVVILGILGRLGDKIQELSVSIDSTTGQQVVVPWHDAITEIVVASNLLDFLELLGGGAIPFILMAATHFAIARIHEIYVNAVGETEVGFFDKASEMAKWEEREQEAIRKLYQYRLNLNWEKRKDEVLKMVSEAKSSEKEETADTSNTSSKAIATKTVVETEQSQPKTLAESASQTPKQSQSRRPVIRPSNSQN